MRIKIQKQLIISFDEMKSMCQQIADRIISEIDSELFKKKDISIQLKEGIEASVDVTIICDFITHKDNHKELFYRNVTMLDVKLFDLEGDKLIYRVDLDELVIKLIETI